VNAIALAKVREDKLRESGDGFDGTWVAHPDLVPVATEVFDGVLGARPNQKDRLRDDVVPDAAAMMDLAVPGGRITEAGVRNNVDVALQYLEAWLRGLGAVAIHNLMEDTATAEISRAQLWQWIRHASPLADGGVVDAALYRRIRDETLAALAPSGAVPAEADRSSPRPRYADAAALLDTLVLGEEFAEFLTIPGYRYLVHTQPRAQGEA
jgi:malate synthase